MTDIHAYPWLLAYITIWSAILGAAAGSFLDCMAWRTIHHESIWHGRSHCTSCGHTLAARDLIPILSYLTSRGRCRHCGAKIGIECLVSELAGAVLFAGLTVRYGLTADLAMWLILGCILMLAAIIDANIRILPDKLLLAAAANRILFFVIRQEPLSGLPKIIGSALAVSVPLLLLVLLMDHIKGRETMGGGDIKLIFVLGLYLNILQNVFLLLAACILALAAAAAAQLRTERQDMIPFGPFLALAWFLVLTACDPLIAWYRTLIAL